ncbi:regulatory protein LuxR [Mycolicibacterium rhodesiae JS60]|nr:regulatory protein LuxR [Mycolicibacterium rhodesiae JS60]
MDTELAAHVMTTTAPIPALTGCRPALSVREKEVLVAWLATESKTAVGQALFITTATVRTHIQRIREKYEAAGRPASTKAALTVRAIQDGIITVDDL